MPSGAPTLSVCSLVVAAPSRAARVLARLRPVAAEIVVAVAAGADTAELAGLADRLHRVPFAAPVERYLPWLHSLCSGDWILRVDENEALSDAFIAALPELVHVDGIVQFRQRRTRPGTRPTGDFAVRLARNDRVTLRFSTPLQRSPDLVLPARFLAEPIVCLDPVSEPPDGSSGPIDVPLAEIDRLWAGRSFGEDGYAVELAVSEPKLELTVGRPCEVDVVIRNVGTETLPQAGGPPAIRAAYHWLAPDGEAVVFDGHRTLLPADIGPGGEAIVPVHVVPPSDPGAYVLELDLVHEGVRWFERGARVPATVAAPARTVRIPRAILDVDKRVICVTGMHRSGTSLVTRILNVLGVYLGESDDLVPAAADNRAGFWERKDVVALNDEILSLSGGAAISPPALETGWEESVALDPLREHAGELLSAWMDGRAIVGWKDPRTSLTLPFWRTVVPVERTVLALRHPLEVARSLWVRNGIDEATASHLFVAYVVSALRNDPDCVVVRYADLFDEPDREIARLAAELALEVPRDQKEKLRGLVDGALRNARLEQLPGEGKSAIAVRVYERLARGDRDGVLRVADELLAWSRG